MLINSQGFFTKKHSSLNKTYLIHTRRRSFEIDALPIVKLNYGFERVFVSSL